MRLKLANETIDQQLDDLQRELEELKTLQLTSQNSGMLGHIVVATVTDSFGDVVEWRTTSTPTPVALSHIPCPATANPSTYNQILCDQIFEPRNGKPAVAVPFVELEVKTGGLHGVSSFVTDTDGDFMLYMEIFNASNVKVGEAYCLQQFGEYLQPGYDPTTLYAWKTTINYTCTQSFDLSYKLKVRSSDRGNTSSKLRGVW